MAPKLKSVYMSHEAKYPLITCTNPECRMHFILISVFIDWCNQPAPTIFTPQIGVVACPYCGYKQVNDSNGDTAGKTMPSRRPSTS